MNANNSTQRRPGAFSPHRPSSPGIFQGQQNGYYESDDSGSGRSRDQNSPRPGQSPRPAIYGNSNASNSTSSFSNFSRPGFARNFSQEPLQHRTTSGEGRGHRREHSQGFFEPTLPSTISSMDNTATLSASQIAAQAAMQHQNHARQRSLTTSTVESNASMQGGTAAKRKPPPIQTAYSDSARRPGGPQTPGSKPYGSVIGGSMGAAATAANAAFPAKVSPNLPSIDAQAVERDFKTKPERLKMHIFSKPRDKSAKDTEKEKPTPSPKKSEFSQTHNLTKMINPSVTSLADSLASGASSIYSSRTATTSTSTLVPTDRQKAEEKEKAHKHHFLSRQKNKLRDKIGDEHGLNLSSSSSNSKVIDPGAPSPLYSFAPMPASPATSSFTGLDLRHAGRAVREKKKEDRNNTINNLPFAPKISDIDRIDFTGSSGGRATPSIFSGPPISAMDSTLQNLGLQNLRPEEVWEFVRSRLLRVFDREDLRIPVEDLNRLVSIHIQQCFSRRGQESMVGDLQSLLATGFHGLDMVLKGVLDQRIVPHLVELWLFVFGTILPYFQAVFLPLDIEFSAQAHPMRSASQDEDQAFGNEFDVRRTVLMSFRDSIILPRYDALKSTFSRLSLDSINAAVSPVMSTFDSLTSSSQTGSNASRPGTSSSLDPGMASYNSQSSTLYDTTSSLPSRSRGNSNLSARSSDRETPTLPVFTSSSANKHYAESSNTIHHRPGPGQRNLTSAGAPDSSHVTETVGRMLQCLSVLASLQSNDDSQAKMEDLTRALKLNWLGRGRVGRVRRGFVGDKGGGGGMVGARGGQGSGPIRQTAGTRELDMEVPPML